MIKKNCLKRLIKLISFLLLFFLLVSCSNKKNEIKFHEACSYNIIDGEETLVCDERKMKKIKSINGIKKSDCEQFKYALTINGNVKEFTGFKCKMVGGYEILQ